MFFDLKCIIKLLRFSLKNRFTLKHIVLNNYFSFGESKSILKPNLLVYYNIVYSILDSRYKYNII